MPKCPSFLILIWYCHVLRHQLLKVLFLAFVVPVFFAFPFIILLSCFSMCYVNIDVSKGPILKLPSLCCASSTLITSAQSIGRNLQTSISSTDVSKANDPVFIILLNIFIRVSFRHRRLNMCKTKWLRGSMSLGVVVKLLVFWLWWWLHNFVCIGHETKHQKEWILCCVKK